MRDLYNSEPKDRLSDNETLWLISAIYREAGNLDVYMKLRSKELDLSVPVARVQSAAASCAVSGIKVSGRRIRLITDGETVPVTPGEQAAAGYCSVLDIIRENAMAVLVNRVFIQQLHKTLFSPLKSPQAGKLKSGVKARPADGQDQKGFIPVPPEDTAAALDRLCAEYSSRPTPDKKDYTEPLIAIALFIRDFLCIQPFDEGNGRMSRLLTDLLLFRSGFYVGRYISLEDRIYNSRDRYFEALEKSQAGWNDGTDAPLPFIKYFLQMLLSAYRQLSRRYALTDPELSALDMVSLAAGLAECDDGSFTKQDIRDLCPSLSLSSVEGSLRKLVAEGKLKREGVGKSIYYERIK